MEQTLPDAGDEEQDRVQRILNDYKRRDLEEQFDAQFFQVDPSTPPEIEADWLNYIEDFERQHENAHRIPMREFLGYPVVQPLAEIPTEEIAEALDKLLDLLAEHNIYLDTLCEVADPELYRFISEELLNKEIDDIRIPGLNTHFIYEEFYPNDEYDVKSWSEDFLSALLQHRSEFMDHYLSQDELQDANGAPLTRAEMLNQIEAFWVRNPVITNVEVKALTARVNDDAATVEIATAWESIKNPGEGIKITGRSLIQLQRCRYGGWDIIQARIAGWHNV